MRKFLKRVEVQDWGMIGYKEAWDRQELLLQEDLALKQKGEGDKTRNYLILCEHPPVFTIGKGGKREHLLISEDRMARESIELIKTNRGGDITFHGPEQLVCYPIFDLEKYYTDLGKYIRAVEQAVIQTLETYGISGERMKGEPGVWIDADIDERARKICALGVRSRRWITMHGIALNVNTDMRYFDMIIPCGIENKGVTSIEKEVGHRVDINEVKEVMIKSFQLIFDTKMLIAENV